MTQKASVWRAARVNEVSWAKPYWYGIAVGFQKPASSRPRGGFFFGVCRRKEKKKPAPQAPSGAAGRLRVLWGTVGERYKGYYNLRIMYASHF